MKKKTVKAFVVVYKPNPRLRPDVIFSALEGRKKIQEFRNKFALIFREKDFQIKPCTITYLV